jgi:hypothetical protein
MSFVVRGVKRAAGKLQARDVGEYMNFDDAVKVARQHIDDFIYREYRRTVGQGISVGKLYERYKSDGELMLVQPKIKGDTAVMDFDAYEYAAEKCAEICAQVPPPKTKS